jgi:hypothetical protein
MVRIFPLSLTEISNEVIKPEQRKRKHPRASLPASLCDSCLPTLLHPRCARRCLQLRPLGQVQVSLHSVHRTEESSDTAAARCSALESLTHARSLQRQIRVGSTAPVRNSNHYKCCCHCCCQCRTRTPLAWCIVHAAPMPCLFHRTRRRIVHAAPFPDDWQHHTPPVGQGLSSVPDFFGFEKASGQARCALRASARLPLLPSIVCPSRPSFLLSLPSLSLSIFTFPCQPQCPRRTRRLHAGTAVLLLGRVVVMSITAIAAAVQSPALLLFAGNWSCEWGSLPTEGWL